MKDDKLRIIFMDIDGVHNSERTLLAAKHKGLGYFYLDPVSVNMMNVLCKETNAKIVISSTWRKNFKEFALMHTLQVAGFDSNHFYMNGDAFYTPYKLSHSTRGMEIDMWFEDFGKPDYFCCIDDRTDFKEHHNLVCTNPEYGFTSTDYWKAYNFLTEKNVKPKIHLF